MSRTSVHLRRPAVAAIALLGSLAFASHLEAQKPTVARITPYVGYITFGDYVDGPIGTSISNDGAVLYGVALGLDVAPQLALVGNLGYTQSDVKVRIPIVGGVSIASSKILLYDAGLQYRFGKPTALGTGAIPFIEGGLGAIRYELSKGPLTTNTTNFAGNIGGGLDVQVNPTIGVRGAVKDYIGKFDFKEATAFSLESKVAHNVAFTLGLTLSF